MAAILTGAGAGVLAAQAQSQSQPIRVTPENIRFNNYLRDLAGPTTLVKVIGGGVLGHVGGNPADLDEYDNLAGEIASKAGQVAVQTSVRHGLAALMQHSTEYQPCDCRGFGNKVEHALLETFTDRRADGSRALSVPRMTAAYAGSFARMAWEPDRDAGEAAVGATLSLGFSAVFNIARELTGVGR